MTAEEYQLFDELLATVNTMRKAKGLSWTELGIYSHVANPILWKNIFATATLRHWS